MTPKEKAAYLINKYNMIVLDTALGGSNKRVISCAGIAVDEICSAFNSNEDDFLYWTNVKKELNKL
jgi:hypothetical protein